MSFIISAAISLDVSSTSCIQFSGSPALLTASLIIFARQILEFMASFPPLKITALPDLRQSTAASIVTLGRDSKIIPITPSGTFVFKICKPFGRMLPLSTFPTGSSIAISSLTPFAIPFILSSESLNLSCIDCFILFSAAASRSFAFASSILSVLLISAFAIFSSASFFSFVEAAARIGDDSFAFLPSVSI